MLSFCGFDRQRPCSCLQLLRRTHVIHRLHRLSLKVEKVQTWLASPNERRIAIAAVVVWSSIVCQKGQMTWESVRDWK